LDVKDENEVYSVMGKTISRLLPDVFFIIYKLMPDEQNSRIVKASGFDMFFDIIQKLIPFIETASMKNISLLHLRTDSSTETNFVYFFAIIFDIKVKIIIFEINTLSSEIMFIILNQFRPIIFIRNEL
jgi:hypothetical protein